MLSEKSWLVLIDKFLVKKHHSVISLLVVLGEIIRRYKFVRECSPTAVILCGVLFLFIPWAHQSEAGISINRARRYAVPYHHRILRQQLMPLCHIVLIVRVSDAHGGRSWLLDLFLWIISIWRHWRHWFDEGLIIISGSTFLMEHIHRCLHVTALTLWFHLARGTVLVLFHDRVVPWVFIAGQIRGMLVTTTPIRLIPLMRAAFTVVPLETRIVIWSRWLMIYVTP